MLALTFGKLLSTGKTMRHEKWLYWPDACRTDFVRISLVESYLARCQRLLSSLRVFGNGTKCPELGRGAQSVERGAQNVAASASERGVPLAFSR